MQVSIKTKRNGVMVLRLDEEAASAILASVTFTSQFHPKIAMLARATDESLADNTSLKRDDGRRETCH